MLLALLATLLRTMLALLDLMNCALALQCSPSSSWPLATACKCIADLADQGLLP
ncbi:hypothetical protein GcM3_c146o131 [Golovinomyces cichoracearum]|uniref:Effector protein n=1 Tax=Golovinomyces cichoracearum TaxID=62708 RepID=A0A420J3D7_9PEZI|nr:hypothetical protein GcM3_c146o131 [Golovinomyces cichoracearum]